MKQVTIGIFVCLLFLSRGICKAQNPYSVRYSIEEGLPTSNMYSVFEDQDGYLWLGTDVGVLRYDGYQFQHFNTDNGVADNEIFKVYQDSEGRIWFLSLNGKLSYYKDQEFHNGRNTPYLEELSHSGIAIDFYEDTDTGEIYFLYIDGYISVLSKDGTVSTRDYRKAARVFSIWEHENDMFVLSGDVIGSLDGEVSTPLKESVYTDAAYRYTIGNDGVFYFSCKNQIFRYEHGDSYELILNIGDSEIIFITIIDDDFWVGTRKGLYVVNEENRQHFFAEDLVSGVIRDSQGNFWVSTLTNGVRYLPNILVRKHNPKTSKWKVNSLHNEEQDQLWIGTEEGLYKKLILKDSAKVYVGDGLDSETKIKRLRSVDGNIIAISKIIHTLGSSSIRNYPFSTNDILRTRDKVYFAGSNHTGAIDVSIFDETYSFPKEKLAKTIADNSLLKNRSNVLAQGGGKVYIGTSTGLHVVVNDRIERINSPGEELNTSILDLFYDDDTNQLLVATNSKGIIIIKEDSIVAQLNTLNGLNSNSCYAIKKYGDDSFFVGTNKGINLIDLSTENAVVKDYSEILNIQKEKVNDLELFSGHLFIASDTELLSFPVESVTEDNFAPKLQIDQILVNGQPAADLLSLHHSMNNVSIRYTGISFSDFGQIDYEYRLNSEKVWTTNKSRQIEFKTLPNGNYNLFLRARGNNGVYSPEKEVRFVIKPPFWKTTWFILAVGMVVAMLIWYLVKRRLRSVQMKFDLERKSLQAEQERATLEKEMIELEQKALRMQMNPHFIFNALNTIKGYYSGGEIKDANTYISRFSKLLRMILESDERLVSLQKEITMLELYIELIQLRYKDVFQYEIDVEEEVNSEEIGIPPLLLQPIVENAVIHGLAPNKKEGVLQIRFTKKDGFLVCRVIDNGVGYLNSKKSKDRDHQSKAMKITRERIDHLNKNKDPNNFTIIQKEDPLGTQVDIIIPIINLW